ncbi:MAG: hypothetical protein BGO89_13680 [Candidatus Kapaibacterium thiocyanatum]|uniref:Uncharacterized protein n=1 Tax=Candidatus Kapaibacterium thiocyanatum TaxID=1895771 RepID=A0A1M3L506_9BACT|nr:MAG: hypothetical protein BGO89_13680 ['Candidatus Kapabacteria' thiocyanatum]
MYKLFFYCIYRTSQLRRGDAIFDGTILTFMLVLGHTAMLFSLLEIVLYQFFQLTIRSRPIVDGRILVGACGVLGFILLYKYFRKQVQSILAKYEKKYSTINHWKGFAICAIVLCVNTVIAVFALILSRSVLGLDR